MQQSELYKLLCSIGLEVYFMRQTKAPRCPISSI